MIDKRVFWAGLGCGLIFAVGPKLDAQTLATGDTRTVVEPTIPSTCMILTAQQAIVAGGPASETTLDTSRIQAALTACPSGKVVELAPSGTNYAFLMGPITIPTGVGLLVDGGVTVFGSRNPADYQTTSAELCGTYGPSGNGCYALITFVKNGTGQGLYGYGVIDARGGSTMLGGPNPGESWWTNADNADGKGGQDNPIIISASVNNLTLYKITLRNSPQFHVGWQGTGLTIWGVKISAPWTAHNTDGIDPTGSNITITNSSISDGDDDIAVGASSPSANVTISNVNTYSGHGLSVGSYTSGGLTNYLVENVNMAGTAADSVATGLRLKSAADRGGLLNTLTYENICMRDVRSALQLNPLYNTNTGTAIPQYKNVVYQNIHVLAPTVAKNAYSVQLQGYDANHVTTVTFNNVVFDQLTAANVSGGAQDITINLAGNVYPAFLTSLTGTGVSYTGSATSIASAGVSACTNPFPYIVGELYGSTSSATNLQAASISDTGSITLNAMLEPAMSQTTYNGTSGSWTGVTAPANPVNFYDGATLVGTGTLSANGTLASLTINNPTAGAHTYTAQYPGDSNYPALAFGSVTVNVQGPIVPATTTLTAPAASVYGAPITLSASVTGPGGTPSGTVTFLDGTTALGTAKLITGSATLSGLILAGGSHSLTVTYGGDLVFMPSTSGASSLAVSTATPATIVSSSPTTVAVGGTSAFSATVTGIAGAAIPTGQVVFTDGTTNLGTATLSAGKAGFTGTLATAGTRTINACFGGDGNYAGSCGTVAVTVTPTATSLALVLNPISIYAGGTTTFTATLTPVVAGVTVTFLNGTSTLGTGVTNATGVATYTWTAGTVGTDSITASAAASGNFAASVSTAHALNVVNSVALLANPSSITVTHGTSGTAAFSVQPGGGFAGPVTLTCVTSAPYVTCLLPSSVVSIGGGAATQVTATVGVNETTAALDHSKSGAGIGWALLGPLGLVGLAAVRRKVRVLAVLFVVLTGVALGAVSGCASNAGTVPSGMQTLVVSGVGGGATQTLTITVNIN
jgi:large repetitive protein